MQRRSQIRVRPVADDEPFRGNARASPYDRVPPRRRRRAPGPRSPSRLPPVPSSTSRFDRSHPSGGWHGPFGPSLQLIRPRPASPAVASSKTMSAGETAGRSGIRVDLGGSGVANVETGIPVLDRLLERLAESAGFDLVLEVEPGEAEAEVTAAGRALGEALAGPLRAPGARGFGSAFMASSEALAHVALEAVGHAARRLERRPHRGADRRPRHRRRPPLPRASRRRRGPDPARAAAERQGHPARARGDVQGARRRAGAGMRDQRRDPWLTSPSSAPRRRPRRSRARPTRRRSAPAASSSCRASSRSGPATRSSPAARSRSRPSRSSPISRAILAEAGTGLDRLVKTTVFLQNLDDFQGMNSVYAQHVGEQPPARSTVEVAKLPVRRARRDRGDRPRVAHE